MHLKQTIAFFYFIIKLNLLEKFNLLAVGKIILNETDIMEFNACCEY